MIHNLIHIIIAKTTGKVNEICYIEYVYQKMHKISPSNENHIDISITFNKDTPFWQPQTDRQLHVIGTMYH